MRILAISRRWHRLRVTVWHVLESKVLFPAWMRARRALRESSDALNDQDHKARLRMAVCTRCPQLTRMDICKACHCYMPVKVQIDKAICPQGRW